MVSAALAPVDKLGADMFTASAELYDLIYLTFKDYGGEAAQIADLLRRSNPQYQTVLDDAVLCLFSSIGTRLEFDESARSINSAYSPLQN